MIDEDMSELTEALLQKMTHISKENRTAAILYLSTYLMNHAGRLLPHNCDNDVARHYFDLTRMMEGLMQNARDTRREPVRQRLTLVKG